MAQQYKWVILRHTAYGDHWLQSLRMANGIQMLTEILYVAKNYCNKIHIKFMGSQPQK